MYRMWEKLTCTGHAHKECEICSTWPWKSMDHFPLCYLVMGKNVFSWINDMFFKKEVTTLLEALPVPCRPRHSSSEKASTRATERIKSRSRKKRKTYLMIQCLFFYGCSYSAAFHTINMKILHYPHIFTIHIWFSFFAVVFFFFILSIVLSISVEQQEARKKVR